jgi:hypothetical protein
LARTEKNGTYVNLARRRIVRSAALSRGKAEAKWEESGPCTPPGQLAEIPGAHPTRWSDTGSPVCGAYGLSERARTRQGRASADHPQPQRVGAAAGLPRGRRLRGDRGACRRHPPRPARSRIRNMVRAGVSERVATKASGHRTASTFRRYNITSDEDLRAVAERMGMSTGITAPAAAETRRATARRA